MKRNNMIIKMISICLFITGILMFIIFAIYNNNHINTDVSDIETINWVIVKNGDLDIKNYAVYQNKNLKTITLNSIYNEIKNIYYIDIPSDMIIQEYSTKKIRYTNNELELNYNLQIAYEKNYDEYLDTIFAEIISSGKIYKYQLSDNMEVFLIKTMEDEIYNEKLIIVLKDKLYNSIELTLKNNCFDSSMLKKIVESLKMQNVEHYSRCDMYFCEMNLEGITNKKIVYNQSREKYVNYISNMEFGNELEYFRIVKDQVFDADINIKMEYYRNKETIDNIINSNDNETINMNKYNVNKKIIDINTNEYKIKIDDNILLVINIKKLKDNVNTEDILKDFLNFTYE